MVKKIITGLNRYGQHITVKIIRNAAINTIGAVYGKKTLDTEWLKLNILARIG
ncbi:hypothetical protein VAS14_02141 [Photobacterium angustum S14]|uniref:Uncharacterized protein n=1 Tax=Photobacterium angustum (strain S14 / CCUG 15956) TaxID=314292 RepID=Q1ZQ17_PHOAS|nr:hypothetical protein VAS14_02141 [Photobacterium angustum S14]